MASTGPPRDGPGSSEHRRAAARRGDAALAGHLGDEAAARRHWRDDDASVRATALGALVRAGAATGADFARALSDPSPVVRRRACELASSMPGAGYKELLSDPDPLVVEAACFAVGEVVDSSALDALAAMAVSHTDPLCRESAVAALGAIGDPRGLASVVAALEDRPQVRRRAAVALAAFDGPLAEQALRRCVQDRDWQVRQIAEDLLGISGDVE